MSNSLSHSDLIYLFVDGEATPAERTKLYEALSNNPSLQAEFEDAMRLKAAVEKEVQSAVPPIALTEELFLKAGIAIPLAATTALAPAVPALSNMSTWLPMLKTFIIPALAVTSAVTVGVIKLTESNNDTAKAPQAIVRTIDKPAEHTLNVADQATPIEAPKATYRQAEASNTTAVVPTPSVKANAVAAANASTIAAKTSSPTQNNSTTTSANSTIASKQTNIGAKSDRQSVKDVAQTNHNGNSVHKTSDIAQTSTSTKHHDAVAPDKIGNNNDNAASSKEPIVTPAPPTTSIEPMFVVPTAMVLANNDFGSKGITTTKQSNMIRQNANERASLFGVTEVANPVSFSIERTTAISYLQERKGAVPQPNTFLNNATLGIWYQVSSHNQFGVVGGQESFPFFLVAADGGLSAEPSLTWAGISYRYRASEIESFWNVMPTGRVIAGYSQLGPLAKISVGLEKNINGTFGLSLGTELTELAYKSQNAVVGTGKLSFTLGANFAF